MGIPDQTFTDLAGALKSWDFTPAFPGGYGGSKSVLIVNAWPYDIIDNMLSESSTGFMTRPVISCVLADAPEEIRTLGEIYGPGSGALYKVARRTEVAYIVTAWADQQLGGNDTAVKITGQAQGAFLASRNNLSLLRHLRVTRVGNGYRDREQLWRCDMTVRGFAVLSYDPN